MANDISDIFNPSLTILSHGGIHPHVNQLKGVKDSGPRYFLATMEATGKVRRIGLVTKRESDATIKILKLEVEQER